MTKYKFVNLTPINKGWSEDKKFCGIIEDGSKFFVRTSLLTQYEKKKEEFNVMTLIAKLGIPMCHPIDLFTTKDNIYTIQSWIEGIDAEQVIPFLSEDKQYELGKNAGRYLKIIHSIPAPCNQEDWSIRFNRKIEDRMKKYNDCPIKIDGGDILVEYINANRHLLINRPQSFQHGDYHIGNMMIENDNLIIVDFNRFDYGDPWEEFNRIVWSAQKSPTFACGIINGYFDNNPPYIFWQLMALYIANNIISSLYWAKQFGPEEVDTMLNQAKEVLNWYSDMKNVIPTWYTNHLR